MKRNSLLVLAGLVPAFLGSILFYDWFNAPAWNDGTAGSTNRPPHAAAPRPSPTPQQQPEPKRIQDDRSIAESVALPGLPVSRDPGAWEKVKVGVEMARRRLREKQLGAIPDYRRKAPKPPQESKASLVGTSLGAEEEEDSAAVLPPVIVPFSPQDPSRPATLPAVLADFPTGGGITPEQQAGMDQLAQDFLEAVTDPNANPKDPVYQNRWQQAQITADQLFRLRYGDFSWMLRHNAAHRQALGENSRP